MIRAMEDYLEHLAIRNYSPHTIHNRRKEIRFFVAWADDRGLDHPGEITREVVERYQRHLFRYRKKDGKPLSTHSRYGRLSTLRIWLGWLAKQRRLPHNPASEIELPRLEQRLPEAVLSAREAEAVGATCCA